MLFHKFSVLHFYFVLISTYWNVNRGSTVVEHNEQGVLISTYWNVNIFEAVSKQVLFYVLISTYWNVNLCKRGEKFGK